MDLVFKGDANAVPRSCVTVHEPGARPRKMPLWLELYNHSPTGFGWGYDGAAPAQLARAILAEVTGDNALAVRLHQEFKRDVIAKLWALLVEACEELGGVGWRWQSFDCALGKARHGGIKLDRTQPIGRSVARSAAC